MQNKLIYIVTILTILSTVSLSQEEHKYPRFEHWKPQKDIQYFTEDNLFEYIDGAAELFLSYQFKQLDVVYYKNRKNQEITLEVYTHASPLYAYGIYSQERYSDSEFINLGAESYKDGNNLFILSGKYYIKIYSYDLADDENHLMINFAKEVINHLKGINRLPQQIIFFPEKSLVPYSIQFIAKNMLGYSFFNNGFQAYYNFEDQKYRLFFIKSESIKEANDLFDQYVIAIHQTPRIPGSDEYKVNDPYHGQGIIRKYKHYVYGGFGPEFIIKVLDEMKLNFSRQ